MHVVHHGFSMLTMYPYVLEQVSHTHTQGG